MTTHQIAIITIRDSYTSYDDYDVIVNSITDWSEVTTEELNLLTRYAGSSDNKHKFRVIERKDTSGSSFLPTTIEQFKKLAVKEEAERVARAAKEKKEAEERAAKRLAKKLAKQEATEKQALEELAKKHGLTLVKSS